MKDTDAKVYDELNHSIGMLLGLAIGDALGAPIEFQPSREPENYVTKYISGGVHNVTFGEFTDDTSMALAMADAFIEANGFNPSLIMDNFLRWKNEGAYSPRGVMFDCGNTVYSALTKYEQDKSNPFTGSIDHMSAGNGGLMRLAPAIIAARYEKEAIKYAIDTTRLTHGCDEAVKYSEMLAKELWHKKPLEEYSEFKHPLDMPRHEVMSGGYVKETYQAAWWAFQTTDSFEDCIIKAINRGHDADTTGAVAGMIAGAIYGLDAIPKWMIEGLQWNKDIIEYANELYKLSITKTSRDEIKKVEEQLPSNPSHGQVVIIDGRKCVCIHPWVSYGGGSLSCWAVEGHSAQMTFHPFEHMPYLLGTCTEVSDDGTYICFEPIKYIYWPNSDSSQLEKKINITDINRYDTNWYI